MNSLQADQAKQTRKAQKRIKKLKKVCIWPSVVFFILSIVIAEAAVVAMVSLFISYLFQEKFDSSLKNTKYISTVLESNLYRGDSYDDALDFLEFSGSYQNPVAILDENNELLGQYGTPSYDLTRGGSLELWNYYEFYMDQSSTGEIFDASGRQMIHLHQLFKRCFDEMDMEDEKWLNTQICNEPYWIVVHNETLNIKFLIRNELILTRKDVIFILGIGAVILILMFIPILFLFIQVISNITRSRRMYRLLSMDSVTGGNNWFYFNNRSEKILNRSRNADKPYAMVHMTYGKYRNYCSCYGVKEGEILLQQFSQYITSHLKKGELCAHTSEADFAILIKCDSKEAADNRIRMWFHEIPTVIPQCHSSFRAGICLIDAVDKSKKEKRRHVIASQLYHNASIARDAISESEERGILFFDDKMRAQQLWEHHVEENMERALLQEEFQVYLQPKYNPVTEELAGAEALVRWINQEDGFVPPGKFIPIFERDGFITKLDDYMIAHVAALQSRWLKEGRKVVPVSVNVSRAHFTRPDLAQHICQLVDQYSLPHELLEIELTESAFFDDKAVLLRTVNSLKEFGFYVSMDDFGAGYSSLNSLKELPLDVLKLDAEFFRGEYEKKRGDIVVSEAIRLAKSLDMKIVAEGIEEKDQVDFLANLGCDMIQGYYFAKPMPVTDYEGKMQ